MTQLQTKWTQLLVHLGLDHHHLLYRQQQLRVLHNVPSIVIVDLAGLLGLSFSCGGDRRDPTRDLFTCCARTDLVCG